MIDFPYIKSITRSTKSKIIMVVADGLGGMANSTNPKSELEIANIPTLDKLSSMSSCGVTTPVLPGITPGSGPGHMALFGYNPIKYLLGRGVLEGLGIGANIGSHDVAARGNFCITDANGIITDRRAGRLTTKESKTLVEILNTIEIPGFEIKVHPVMDYRFVLVLKGPNASADITETDPQVTGTSILESEGLTPSSTGTALAVNLFTRNANLLLSSQKGTANSVILRGFSTIPHLPNFAENYKLKPAAIAGYPMYRGVAGLLGMNILECGQTFTEELDMLKKHYSTGDYDYFFVHYKPADTAGEDGDFDGKVKALENFDSYLKEIVDLKPDVLVVCGDHSTPSLIGSHSWHEVPFLIHSENSQGMGDEYGFSELNCKKNGSIGSIQAEQLMLLVLAHANKLNKFGP
jgi:2,3-bisphosphoglycerate-independent phosphoglycerate mutase